MTSNENSYIQKIYQFGWHDLINLLFKEFISNTDNKAQGLSTLRDIGTSLANCHPLERKMTINALEDEINRLLSKFNWGFIRIAPAPQELIIIHCGWPHTINAHDEQSWRLASATVLEGLYSQWLTTQGASKDAPVIWKGDSTEDVLIFRYSLT